MVPRTRGHGCRRLDQYQEGQAQQKISWHRMGGMRVKKGRQERGERHEDCNRTDLGFIGEIDDELISSFVSNILRFLINSSYFKLYIVTSGIGFGS